MTKNSLRIQLCRSGWWDRFYDAIVPRSAQTGRSQLGKERILNHRGFRKKSIQFRFIENKKSGINETGLDVFNNYITTKYWSIVRPLVFSFNHILKTVALSGFEMIISESMSIKEIHTNEAHAFAANQLDLSWKSNNMYSKNVTTNIIVYQFGESCQMATWTI